LSESIRQELIKTALALNAGGINQGTSGNISVRFDQGMLITPTGAEYHDLDFQDIVFVDRDGQSSGLKKPSSEWRIHHDIYRHRPDAKAIIHAHPTHCAALACLRLPIPSFHYMVAKAGGRDIRCAEYATFGSQALSDYVLASMENRKACLMANHGLMVLEATLAKSLALAIEVEHLAQTYRNCLAVGEPVLLSESEMDQVIQKFRNYGVSDS
jgi:L-fuculose-phosphate aldolase